METMAPQAADSVAAIAKLARETALTITTVDAPGLPSAIPIGLRGGHQPEAVDLLRLLEPWRTAPARRTGTAQTQTLESFIALLNRHKVADSAVFADTSWKSPSFTAVIDYHPLKAANDVAAFGGHRVGYRFPLSEEWQDWSTVSGRVMDQTAFAEFLEEHIADLSAPTDAEVAQWQAAFSTTIAHPAQMMALSRGLKVSVAATVKEATTLQSGEGHVSFEETHKGMDGKPLRVPGLFVLAISPFFMGAVDRIPARLRYRVRDGRLAWSFQIYRPDQVITARVRLELDRVARETGLPTFEGSAEMMPAVR